MFKRKYDCCKIAVLMGKVFSCKMLLLVCLSVTSQYEASDDSSSLKKCTDLYSGSGSHTDFYPGKDTPCNNDGSQRYCTNSTTPWGVGSLNCPKIVESGIEGKPYKAKGCGCNGISI